MYLPIYVVRHYVANFYFPLLLCTHTFIYLPIYEVRHYVANFSHYSYVSTHLYILTLCSTIKLTLGTKGIDPHGLPLSSEGFQAFLLR